MYLEAIYDIYNLLTLSVARLRTNKVILCKTYRLFWIVNGQRLKPLSIVGVT